MSAIVASVTARCVHCTWKSDHEHRAELDEIRSIHELIHPGGTVLVGVDGEAKPDQRAGAKRNGAVWSKDEVIAAIEAETGLNRATLSQIERGILVPSPVHLLMLSDLYGVPPEEWRLRIEYRIPEKDAA